MSSVEVYERAGAKALSSGLYADALYYLREGYWVHWVTHPFELCEQLCEVYTKLGRPALARIVGDRISKWKNVQ